MRYASYLSECFWLDRINRVLVALSVALAVTVWLVWRSLLSSPDIYVYVSIGVYPVKLLALFLLLNSILAITSYKREREVSYLLFMTNIIITLLVLTLEIFYLRVKLM